LPSTAVSSAPVTVTVWAVFQLEEENIIEEGETVPSVVSELLIAIETFADGWLFKFTVKVAVPPASVVEAVIALMTKTPGVEPEPPESPESPESPPDESTSLWLEPAFEFFKSFCSLHDVTAAMKNKIRILKGHLLFKVLRIFILI
jgi:hypothetical protein